MKTIASLIITASLLFASCSSQKTGQNQDHLVLIQVIDRSGLTETISVPERLENYERVNFEEPQPYKQVMRIFSKDEQGRSRSVLTSYHANGGIFQYLEGKDTRANGTYLEWHPNGKRKIEATVIEGPADLSPAAQKDWVFHDISRVWDEEEHLIAEMSYDRGVLNGTAKYYHANGSLAKTIPYVRDEIHGELCLYSETGSLSQKTFFENGLKEGPSIGYWENESPSYIESYEKDKLVTGIYLTALGVVASEIQNGAGFKTIWQENGGWQQIEYRNGFPEGKVDTFNAKGDILTACYFKDGKKQGEEIHYFLPGEATGKAQTKLQLYWDDGQVHGTVKTWYNNGRPESQKEYYRNKKNGMSCAWYKEGSLMFVEEYENDALVSGSYYKFKQNEPISKVIQGSGIATLFDGGSHFLRKIKYVNGKPQE